MNCQKAELWISRSLDGELPESQRPGLEEHLSQCSNCRQLREQWLTCGQLMKDRKIVPGQTPEAAWADVQRAIRLQAPQKQRVKFPLVFGWQLQLGSAILALVVVGFGVHLWSRASSLPVAARAPASSATTVEMVESGLPGASTVVYEDSNSGMMVIWLLTAEDKEKKHADS
ncbi:MAG: zf-HC2 domain-containing protein [Lentisphaerota bacterium]